MRGLDVLRLLNEDGPATATAISRRANLPQPTVIRLLETLIATGYVYRVEDSNVFGLTARTLSLSKGFDSSSRLVQLAQPLIEELRAEIGWPSNLAVFADTDTAMTIAYTNRNALGMAIPGRLGARLPLLVTAVGIAFLANQGEQERTAILERLRASRYRWDTDPEVWAKLDQKIVTAQREGYALAEQSYLDVVYDSKIWAVAVPIPTEGRVTSALSTLILRSAGEQRRILDQVLPMLTKSAAEIGNRLTQDASDPGAHNRSRPPSTKLGRGAQ